MAQQTQSNTDDFSWMVPIEVMLGSIDHREVQACSICSIPDKLRKPKENAYKPNIVSIGPLHRGTRSQLLLMEEPKWRFTLSLLRRTGAPEETRRAEVRLRDCGATTLGLIDVIQASYGGNLDLDPYELAKIMLVDGCFLLELLLRLRNYMEAQSVTNIDPADDPILGNEQKLFSALNDLALLENQVPLVVLKKLYRKIFPANVKIEDDHRVADIVLNAFGFPLVHRSGVAHLLHLMHLSLVNQENNEVKLACEELKHCATSLRASGITFRPPANTNVPNNTPQRFKFVGSFDFNINFSNEAAEIPPLHIKETTEAKWRNMIAWEQSRIGIRCKFTSYALFFQGLICCEHDIELLEESKVIVNDSNKSKEDLLRLFRTMAEGVDHMDSSFSEVCERLNKYHSTRPLKNWPLMAWHQWRRTLAVIGYYWQNWYQILIRDHIPSVWKLIGVLAAAILLALTIMQTYYAARNN